MAGSFQHESGHKAETAETGARPVSETVGSRGFHAQDAIDPVCCSGCETASQMCGCSIKRTEGQS